jgi:hypothetical protein
MLGGEIMVAVCPRQKRDYDILRTVLKYRRVTRLRRGIYLLMPRSGLSLYYVARLMKAMGSSKLTVKRVEGFLLEKDVPSEVWELAEKQKLSKADKRRLSRLKEVML